MLFETSFCWEERTYTINIPHKVWRFGENLGVSREKNIWHVDPNIQTDFHGAWSVCHFVAVVRVYVLIDMVEVMGVMGCILIMLVKSARDVTHPPGSPILVAFGNKKWDPLFQGNPGWWNFKECMLMSAWFVLDFRSLFLSNSRFQWIKHVKTVQKKHLTDDWIMLIIHNTMFFSKLLHDVFLPACEMSIKHRYPARWCRFDLACWTSWRGRSVWKSWRFLSPPQR